MASDRADVDIALIQAKTKLALALAAGGMLALLVGLGGAGMPKQFLNDYPKIKIDVVEIDKTIPTVAKQYFGLKDSDRLSIIIDDGRRYIKKTEERYDLIFMDAYGGTKYGLTIGPHLVTQEFFREVKKKLTPKGVVAYNIGGNLSGFNDKLTRAMIKTMRTVFPTLYIYPTSASALLPS